MITRLKKTGGETRPTIHANTITDTVSLTTGLESSPLPYYRLAIPARRCMQSIQNNKVARATLMGGLSACTPYATKLASLALDCPRTVAA